MKYFKHHTDAGFNKKINRLKRAYKAEGYGIYFQIIELIGHDLNADNFEDWGFLPKDYQDDMAYLSDVVMTDPKTLKEVIDFCYQIDLFEKRGDRLYCQRVLDEADEYTQRLINTMKKKAAEAPPPKKNQKKSQPTTKESRVNPDSNGMKSGHTRDNIPTHSVLSRELEEEGEGEKEREYKNPLQNAKEKPPDTAAAATAAEKATAEEMQVLEEFAKKNPIKDLNYLIAMFKPINPNFERLFPNKSQRAALQRQVNKFTLPKIENLLTQLPVLLARPYCPQITTPVQLENKMGDLINFMRKEKLDLKMANGPGNMKRGVDARDVT
jgi:hypothetical protein